MWEKPLKDNRSEDMVLSEPDLSSAVGDENLKTLLALVPFCLEASSIPGFPSAPPHSLESIEANGKACVVRHAISFFPSVSHCKWKATYFVFWFLRDKYADREERGYWRTSRVCSR
jgi:hypothetical protein